MRSHTHISQSRALLDRGDYNIERSSLRTRMAATPKQRNWLQGDAAPVPSRPSDFERVVAKLKLSPEQYESSDQLRQWVERYWQQKFVPEKLLKAWGLDFWPLTED